MRRRALAAVALAALGALVPGRASPADQPQTLTLAVAATSTSPSAISFILHPVLDSMPDFFQKVGLHVDLSAIQMGNAVALTQTGNPPVIEGTGFASIAAGYQQGTTDVKFFLGELQKSPYELVVRKGITKMSQIKTLGVPSLDSASSQACQQMLSANHVIANKDYTMVLIGTSGSRVAAVQAGKVDGSCELVPYPELYHDQYGLTILQGVQGKALPWFAAGGWGYNKKWAEDPEHHEAVVRLAEADLLAIRWLYAPANKPKVLDMIAKRMDVPPKYAEILYDRLVGEQAYTPDGYIPRPAADTDAHIMVDIGLLKSYPAIAQYFDWSILETAAQRLKMHIRKPEY